MVFSSLLFLGIFLPTVLIFYNLSKNITYKNVILVIASLVFYAWGEPRLVLLLVATAFVGYISGLMIDSFGDKGKKERCLLPHLLFVSAHSVFLNIRVFL